MAALLMGSTYFDTLTEKILTGIKASNPAASNLGLSSADVTEGVALIKEAQTLLSVWFSGQLPMPTVSRTVSKKDLYAAY